MNNFNEKIYKLIIFMILVVFIGPIEAQDESQKSKEKSNKDINADIWLITIWEDIDEIEIQDRAFETEKVTAVAGVRGKEAEADILKHLYIRKNNSEAIPKKLEIAIEKLESILQEHPTEARIPQWKHYLIQCYIQQGNNSKANSLEKELIKDFPNSKWTAIYTKKQP